MFFLFFFGAALLVKGILAHTVPLIVMGGVFLMIGAGFNSEVN